MENLAEISIENIIIHQVFRRNKDKKTSPEYSDMESELNDEINCQRGSTFFHFRRSRIFQPFDIKFTQFSRISVELL